MFEPGRFVLYPAFDWRDGSGPKSFALSFCPLSECDKLGGTTGGCQAATTPHRYRAGGSGGALNPLAACTEIGASSSKYSTEYSGAFCGFPAPAPKAEPLPKARHIPGRDRAAYRGTHLSLSVAAMMARGPDKRRGRAVKHNAKRLANDWCRTTGWTAGEGGVAASESDWPPGPKKKKMASSLADCRSRPAASDSGVQPSLSGLSTCLLLSGPSMPLATSSCPL